MFPFDSPPTQTHRHTQTHTDTYTHTQNMFSRGSKGILRKKALTKELDFLPEYWMENLVYFPY